MVLEKELRVLHLDPNVAKRDLTLLDLVELKHMIPKSPTVTHLLQQDLLIVSLPMGKHIQTTTYFPITVIKESQDRNSNKAGPGG